MAEPTPAPAASTPPAPAVPPVLAPRPGSGRLWGIIDLVLLVAIAAGAAFYAMKETIFRQTTQVVDHPVGPLTHVRDGALDSPAPTVTTSPAN